MCTSIRASIDVSYRALADYIGADHVRLYRMLNRQQAVDGYVLGRALAGLAKIMEARR